MHVIETMRAERLGIEMPEVLRYMGCRADRTPQEVQELTRSAVHEMESAVQYSACVLRLPLCFEGGVVQVGTLSVESTALKRHLEGCTEAFLFAATIGMTAERRLAAASRLTPARAIALDAAGSAAIEGWCAELCRRLEEKAGMTLRRRYSPGYGDFSLKAQADILHMLDAKRRIGLALTDGGMLVPTKSVTALVGIGG